MPVHVVKDGVNPESQVPGRLQKIPVPLLSTSLDCNDKIVKVRFDGSFSTTGNALKSWLEYTVVA